jgi:four helix bundle protein
VRKERINNVSEMDVFKLGHELTLDIYKITSKFPKEEQFDLVSQMRRASYSICSNLSEGSYRNNTKEFKQFCGIARGSAAELKYFILLAKDLGYIDENNYTVLLDRVDLITKMLYKLIKVLEVKL